MHTETPCSESLRQQGPGLCGSSPPTTTWEAELGWHGRVCRVCSPDDAVLQEKAENVTLAQALGTLVHALQVLAKGTQAVCTVVMRSACKTSNKQTMLSHGK